MIHKRLSERLLAVWPHLEDREVLYRMRSAVWFFPVGVITASVTRDPPEGEISG